MTTFSAVSITIRRKGSVVSGLVLFISNETLGKMLLFLNIIQEKKRVTKQPLFSWIILLNQ